MNEVHNRRGPSEPANVIVNIDQDDVQMITIVDDQDDEEILKLSIESPEMSKLRWFVALQRLPSSLIFKSPTQWDTVYQLVIVAVVICHYFYILGAFKNKTLEEEEMHLTLTSIKNVVWCARFPLYTILGLLYFKTTHFENLICSLQLTSLSLNKVKRWLRWSCLIVISFSVVVPVAIRFMEMCFTPEGDTKKGFVLWKAVSNIVFTSIARLFALPIVIIFIVVFAFLYFEIRQFKKCIQSWPVEEKQTARNVFLNIQKQIKKAERAFQPFLIVHITILLLVIVPSILGLVERERDEGKFTHFYDTTQLENLGRANKDFIHSLVGYVPNETHHIPAKQNRPPIVIILPSVQESEKPLVKHNSEKVDDKNAQIRIALQSLAFLAEMLSLYVPLILLGKINKAIKRTAMTIQLLEFDEQQREGYLFQSRRDVEEMLKDLSNAHGVHILGMELTVVKTLLLGVFMPLFTLLLHIMFKHVDLAA